MQAVCAKCSRLMCRAVVLFLVAECAQTTPMIAPLPGDPNFSIDGSVAFFKSGESNPTQPNPPPPPAPYGGDWPDIRGGITKGGVYLKWASHFWLSIQNVNFSSRYHLEQRLLGQAQARTPYNPPLPFFEVLRVAYPKAPCKIIILPDKTIP